jgi:DNA-binding transcriptional ArsR family regulator
VIVELSSITPDPAALRALSHPVRLRILGLLRGDGPATATTLAARLGLNSGATSYHLRQLAAHGFVVDDPDRGNARDRWWRAAHQSTRFDPADAVSPAEVEALSAFEQAIAVTHTERLQRAVEERGLLPHAWRSASTLSDWGIRLTPERARALVQSVTALVEETVEAGEDEQGAEVFELHLHAFPRPGHVVSDPEAGP